jgi:DNA-binding transcriptional ArsR family regulator
VITVFDNYDDEFDDDFGDDDDEEEFEEKVDDLQDELEDLESDEEDLVESINDRRMEAHEAIREARDELKEKIQGVAEVDDIRRELEDVRRMKEEMRRQLDEIRRERDDERAYRGRRLHDAPEPPQVRPVRPVRPPKAPRAAVRTIDLSPLTESLDEMMEGLGRQIDMRLRDVSGLKDLIPEIRVSTSKRRKVKRKTDIESIPPERVARVLTPLASDERLKIMDYLKTGGKTFNELENQTGKTGSSLTHHLSPLVEAGYVIKGEVRGTYYVTVEGRLAYRLAQWLTDRLEREIASRDTKSEGSNEAEGTDDDSVEIIVDEESEDDEE